MRQSVKIALIMGGMALTAGIGYLLFSREDEDDDSKPPTTKPPTTKPPTTKPPTTKPSTTVDYSLHPKIKKLKKKIDTIYLTLEDLENRNGVVVYKSSGKPVSYGLDQGVWILTQRDITGLKNALNAETIKPEVKQFGLEVIEKLQRHLDSIFDPKFYNYNTDWYKEYLKK
jgi:hypothetical protein